MGRGVRKRSGGRCRPSSIAVRTDRRPFGSVPGIARDVARVIVLGGALGVALGGCAGTGPASPERAGTPATPGLSVVEESVPGETGTPADGTVATSGEPDDARPVLVPALDADRDRIGDALDDCPDSPPREIVDDTGCPLFTRVLDGVVFAPNDFRLGAASRLALASLVIDLEAHPGAVVRLEGHTDNRGTAAANLELSKRRVMAVARFLVARGIEPERLKPYGFGESRPRAGNATAPGRERNRRIEIGFESLAPAAPGDLAEPDAERQNGEYPGNPS